MEVEGTLNGMFHVHEERNKTERPQEMRGASQRAFCLNLDRPNITLRSSHCQIVATLSGCLPCHQGWLPCHLFHSLNRRFTDRFWRKSLGAFPSHDHQHTYLFCSLPSLYLLVSAVYICHPLLSPPFLFSPRFCPHRCCKDRPFV